MPESPQERAPSWKAELDDAGIKRLRLERPAKKYDDSGKLVFESEPGDSSSVYIVWDSSPDAPPGFGVKVTRKKTCVLWRKIHGKSLMRARDQNGF